MATTPYDVKIAPHAYRQLGVLSIKHRRAVIQFLETLTINPRPPGHSKIEGMTGLYVEELEPIRIIYKIDEQEVLVLVIKI